MSGTKKKQPKPRRNWRNTYPDQGEINEENSRTMPDMAISPRTIIENHVRGINPITGAVLDSGVYYGNNILPHEKDLTFEELRLKRQALENQLNEFKEQAVSSDQETVPTENSPTTGTNESPEGTAV